ncbi:MAG: hypothetical protein GKR89_36600 [Candidatus Latescibacteria bacterium]|nr:hypothetical protein [Candidatus Latescibacterota bacterium]
MPGQPLPLPLPLPADFDPERTMPVRLVDGRPYHGLVSAAQLAAQLAANGHPQDWQTAAALVRSILECQHLETPHRGNFRWEWEDDSVEDLNAVQFALFYLIPIGMANRLDAALQTQLQAGISLGLEEIRALDVGLDYTNIVLKDIANSILGGELLNDDRALQHGRAKLLRWLQRLDQYGLPAEYNSPNYAAVAFRVLHQLASRTQDRATAVRARTALARLGLSAALHLHPLTRRWAGPFSRAYWPAMFCQTPPEFDDFDNWLDQGLLPAWLAPFARQRPTPLQLRETAAGPVALTTYHTPSISLGIASAQLQTQDIIFIARQSNVFFAHYHRPGQDRPGLFFSRYLLDDKWLGDFRTTPSRAANQLLPEEGRFFGVQDGPRALGLYAPIGLDGFARRTSAKAVLVWTERALIDEIWIDAQPVTDLPASIPPGATVAVASGSMLSAVCPLPPTDLGGGGAVRLVELDGHLALEMYNYSGPAKTFWEMAQPSSFYQGQPQCGFYAEVAERSAWRDGAHFAAEVAGGTLRNEAAPPFTPAPGQQRPWTVEYTRHEHQLGLEVDLMEWQLLNRWTAAGPLDWPLLESPLARQSADGQVTVGQATLSCSQGPAWLAAAPDGSGWIAGYHGSEPTALVLTLPQDRIEIDQMGAGTLHWHNGQVHIDAVDLGAWRQQAQS